MKMNEVLMAEDVLRPYGITLYYKGCEYLRDAIILHWHQPDLIPGQLIQLVANQKGAKKSSALGTISTIANVESQWDRRRKTDVCHEVRLQDARRSG